MEINITKFFNEEIFSDYSGSVAEYGENAGKITWNASVQASEDYQFLKTEEDREAAREYFKGFGAWSDEEIKGWSDTELTALVLQYISGSLREAGIDVNSADAEWEQYYKDAEAGRVNGDIFRTESGEIYYTLGN